MLDKEFWDRWNASRDPREHTHFRLNADGEYVPVRCVKDRHTVEDRLYEERAEPQITEEY